MFHRDRRTHAKQNNRDKGNNSKKQMKLKVVFEKINKIDKALARLIKKKNRGLKSIK